MLSLIHAVTWTQLANQMQPQAPAALPKARAARHTPSVVGAELKCCAPLEPLPRLSPRPASLRGQ